VAADCAGGICPAATKLCAAPSCTDGLKNGSETDLDCGGSCAPAKTCANDKMCVAGSDCASASCVSLKCAAAGCLTCWKAQYQNLQATEVIVSSASFNIVSVGSTTVPLSQLKLRYWFAADGRVPVTPPDCFYPPVYCSDVTTRQIVAVTPPRTGATHYLEITFKAAAGTLAAGGQLNSAIQTQFHYEDWSRVTRTNDYSFDATKTALTDWNRVTLYNCPTSGAACSLVWGVEPP
jgi:hypothetical protein